MIKKLYYKLKQALCRHKTTIEAKGLDVNDEYTGYESVSCFDCGKILSEKIPKKGKSND